MNLQSKSLEPQRSESGFLTEHKPIEQIRGAGWFEGGFTVEGCTSLWGGFLLGEIHVSSMVEGEFCVLTNDRIREQLNKSHSCNQVRLEEPYRCQCSQGRLASSRPSLRRITWRAMERDLYKYVVYRLISVFSVFLDF